MQFLSNEQIGLRSLEPEDLEVLYAIENNPLYWNVGCSTTPYSRFLLRQYIETMSADIYVDKQVRMMIEHTNSKAVLGTVDLVDYDPQNSRAEVGLLVLNEYQGQGYGSQALRLLCDYAFSLLHIHQLYTYVPVDNQASLHVFEKCGFINKLRLKEWQKCGEADYNDVFLLQCFNRSFLK